MILLPSIQKYSLILASQSPRRQQLLHEMGFTFQVIAQKHTPANDAVVILSLQAVFATLFGWMFLHEMLLPVQLAGGALILFAVVLVQVKNRRMETL